MNAGLVALYGIRPVNKTDLFLQFQALHGASAVVLVVAVVASVGLAAA